jgi:hypothetical protein
MKNPADSLEHAILKQSFGASSEEPQPQADSALVQEGIEKLLDSARKAQGAFNSGNDKRMFFALLGAIDALGIIGRAYEVENIGFLVRVWNGFAKFPPRSQDRSWWLTR